MMTLIIVDCQVDFISGSMAVRGSKEAVQNIISYIQREKDNIEKVIFTVDWHPYKHCSFKENGGQWATHCVNYTTGASIDYNLIKVVEDNNLKYQVLQKGKDPNREQYGAFENCETIDELLICEETFFNRYEDVIVCGIAGDYCVKETIKNLYSWDAYPSILLSGVASIDDGSAINKTIKDLNLNMIQ